jgi:hypothetical protein
MPMSSMIVLLEVVSVLVIAPSLSDIRESASD